MRFFKSCIFIVTLIYQTSVHAQDSINHKRLTPLLVSSTLAYGGTLYALSKVWYDNEERTSFHFFNDNSQWQQMDKVGHAYAGYHLSKVSYDGLIWSGVNEDKAALYGSLASLAMLLPIEILDGYAQTYGASVGDIVADIAGSALFIGQHHMWNEQRITPKFSFHRTNFAAIRPEVLGNGIHQEWLKDYNGQTYWLSFDTDKFFKTEKRWLDYINIAIGYGAEGMVYGNNSDNIEAGFKPYRQFYLAPDLDLTAIRTNSKFLKGLFYVLNIIHLPSPALSFGNNKVEFDIFYF